MINLKRIVIPCTCILLVLLVLININKISDKIINTLNPPHSNKIEAYNKYYKEAKFGFVETTDNFTPYGKQDILNIIYTVINSGSKNFTFYCPKEYNNCLADINYITNDADLLTHLNNFVNPLNSFTSINTVISDSGEISLKITYLYTEEEIKTVESEVKKLIPLLITDNLTQDYDKIKAVHDYIINNTKYDLDNNKEIKSYNAYGALVNHLATCNGYTDLMAVFLTQMGYDNFKIATTDTEERKGHVWNAVKVNNTWLHLDLTWDDPVSSDGENYLYHKYFLITTPDLVAADSNITSSEHNFNKAIYQEFKDLN